MPGPNSTTTTHITNATSRVIAIPELIHHIGHHLQPSDLFSCIQVCRQWNQTLIPLLWHTLDTKSGSWQDIIESDASGETPQGELQEWLETIFAKYGHHIRRLTTSRGIILKAASNADKCRNLCSLVVENVEYSHRTATTISKPVTATVVEAGVEDFRLPWIIPLDQDTADEDEDRGQRYMVKRFWIFVRRNPGLSRLSFPDLDAMNDLSKDYIVETLASLEKLDDLDLGRTLLDAQVLLRSLPKLKRLRVFNLNGLSSMRQGEQHVGLRSLGICVYVRISEVLKALNHLPVLEELRFKGIVGEPIDLLRKDILAAELIRDLQLKSLCIDEVFEWDDKYISLLEGQCCHLVHIRMQKLKG